jgi:hypothetical protein
MKPCSRGDKDCDHVCLDILTTNPNSCRIIIFLFLTTSEFPWNGPGSSVPGMAAFMPQRSGGGKAAMRTTLDPDPCKAIKRGIKDRKISPSWPSMKDLSRFHQARASLFPWSIAFPAYDEDLAVRKQTVKDAGWLNPYPTDNQMKLFFKKMHGIPPFPAQPDDWIDKEAFGGGTHAGKSNLGLMRFVPGWPVTDGG